MWAGGFKDRAEIVFLIGQYDQNQRKQMLELGITEKTFRLGCAPIVNLFEQTAEPILLDQRKYEYPIVPDVRRPNATEIFSVDEVVSIDPQSRETMVFEPFYSYRHATIRDKKQTFWLAHRRPSGRRNDDGTEMTISLVDLSSRPVLPDTDALTVRTTCTNRDLPARLPFGNEAGDFDLETASAVKRIVALKKPTNTLRPPTGRSVLWRLISHLSLNYLSLVEEGQRGAAGNPEAVQLHRFALFGEADRRHRLDSRAPRHFARVVSENGITFARGTRVEMELDEEQFVGGGVYLFASVIERFLGLYVSLNSFSQLVASVEAAEGGNPGMAAPSGTPDPAVTSAVRYWDVTQLLTEEPWTFQFFQAVRLLERILPDRAPIGRFVHPSKEIVRINVHTRHGLSCEPDPGASLGNGRRARDGGQLHGPVRPIGRAAAVLHRDDPGTPARERHHAGRVLQYLQPPHDLAVLSGVGEVPVHDRVRTRRAGPVLASPAGPDRVGHAGPAEAAGRAGRLAFVL